MDMAAHFYLRIRQDWGPSMFVRYGISYDPLMQVHL
jgi:hypothetical protein